MCLLLLLVVGQLTGSAALMHSSRQHCLLKQLAICFS
jgi:hypothetical protein